MFKKDERFYRTSGMTMFIIGLIITLLSTIYMYSIPECKSQTISFIDGNGDNVTITANNSVITELMMILREGKPLTPPELQDIFNTNPAPSSITTTTTLRACVCEIPPCRCQPNICPDYGELTVKSIEAALQYHPNKGSFAYQSGAFDTKDYFLELFKIPGRPDYASRPALNIQGMLYKPDKNMEEVLLRRYMDDRGYYLLFNRTPDMQGRKRWTWNDGSCLSHILRVDFNE